MSWKRARMHSELMLENLGLPRPMRGRQDLKDRKLILIDDETNPYRVMCFSLAAKSVKRRGGQVEQRKPNEGEIPHAQVIEIPMPPEPPRPPRSPKKHYHQNRPRSPYPRPPYPPRRPSSPYNRYPRPPRPPRSPDDQRDQRSFDG